MSNQPPRPPDWLTVHEALERILTAVHPLPPERVPLLDALGRTLAESVVSPIDQPPWANSAMDGFAARADDVRGASRDRPVVLDVIEDVPAGAFPTRPVGPGHAVKVMTGAPIPEGADSVVRLEHTSAWGEAGHGGDSPAAGPGQVAVFRDDDAGRNFRRRGEDFEAGEEVLGSGHVLRPAELGVLATVGRAEVAVHRRPRVAILSNGDELASLDEFDQVRAGRKIVNSNSYALAGAVRATGCISHVLGIARDDETSLRAHLEAARDADVVVTTAGASVGEHDLIKDVLEMMGFRLDFWRVKMKPGSPVSFGRLGRGEGAPGAATGPNAARALPVFGLPGNPVSALVTFEILVRPALRRMLGRAAVHSPTVAVRVADRIVSRPGLTRFQRVTLEPTEDGREPLARLTGPQGSGILTSMARADALLVIAEDAEGIEAGDLATAIPLPVHDEGRANVAF